MDPNASKGELATKHGADIAVESADAMNQAVLGHSEGNGAVIVTAAPPKVPQPLLDQLKIGGRMISPVGNTRQELVLIRRRHRKCIS